MAAPTYVTGQVLAASDCNSWFTELAAYKTSVTTRTTLTPSIDPDLQFSLPTASAFWEVRAGIIYQAASGGFAYSFAFPAGAGGGYTAAYNNQTTGSPLAPGVFGQAWGTVYTAGTPSSYVEAVQVQGIISTGATTGTFGLSWAGFSGPVSLTCGIGSYLLARRVG